MSNLPIILSQMFVCKKCKTVNIVVLAPELMMPISDLSKKKCFDANAYDFENYFKNNPYFNYPSLKNEKGIVPENTEFTQLIMENRVLFTVSYLFRFPNHRETWHYHKIYYRFSPNSRILTNTVESDRLFEKIDTVKQRQFKQHTLVWKSKPHILDN